MKRTLTLIAAMLTLIMTVIVIVVITGDDSDASEAACPQTGPSGVGLSGPTGVRIAGLGEAQLQIARNIVAIGRQRNMPESVILAELEAGAAESGYRNLANTTVPESAQYPHDGEGSNADSVGPFQIKASLHAGEVGGLAKLMDPVVQIGWWYDRAQKVPGYQTMDPGALAQAVEISGNPGAYGKQQSTAQAVLAAFNSITPATATLAAPATTAPAATALATTTVAGQTSTTASTAPPAHVNAKVIAIDPGHGPAYQRVDPATGLVMQESPNMPEMTDVWDVAQRLASALRGDGYTVVLTKPSVDADVSFRQRADEINASGAVLAVAIHTSGAGSPNQATPQVVGEYRETPDGRRVAVTNTSLATKSQQAAALIARERTAAEGHTVVTTPISFDGRSRADIPSPGDIPIVSLFSTVPMVYNELGRDPGTPFQNGTSDGLTEDGKTRYMTGLLRGIEAYASTAAPSTSPVPGSDTSTVGTTGISTGPCGASAFVPGAGPFGATAVAAATHWLGTPYAWGGGTPDGPSRGIHGNAVADEAGDFNKTGFDCSGLMIYAIAQASGHRIILPHNDQAQMDDPRGKHITDPADLQPGDVIQPHPGHVFMFIGNNQIVEAPESNEVVHIRAWNPATEHGWQARRFG